MHEKILEERLKAVETLAGAAAVMAFTNNASIALLASVATMANQSPVLATTPTHSEHRRLMLGLLKEAGMDTTDLERLDTIVNQVVAERSEILDMLKNRRPVPRR